MATDRLAELQKYGTFLPLDESGDAVIDIAPGDTGGFSFEKDIGEVKENMANIRKNFKLIKDTFNKQMWSSSQGMNKGSSPGEIQSDDLEELLLNTNRMANFVRFKLKNLKDVYMGMNPDDPQKRVLHSVHGPLTLKFRDLMKEYSNLQIEYKDKYKSKIQRQAEIVMPGISADEVDKIIRSGESERIFANKILDDQKCSEARTALLLMQEQQRDLMYLERSINELNSLFIDVTTLLDAQGDALSDIAKSTSAAADKTVKSLKLLETAESLARKRRKKCIIVISAIVGVILVILAVTLAPLAAAA